MKKILHFSLANTRGGVTQYVLNNWKHIDKTRFRFDMASFGGKLDFQGELEKDGCQVFYIKNRAEENLSGFRDEILRIFSNGYDAVHLHTSFWKSFELERLARQADIPRIIVHAHNTAVFEDDGREEKERRHNELVEELTPDIATDFWACSEAAGRWLYADKIPREKIRIVNNAIDIRRFAFDDAKRREYRGRLGWEDKVVIGHVGRFSYQKNHEFLIYLFKAVVEKKKNARLLLIGKGPLEERVDCLVRQFGLTDKVCFVGACDDVNGWLQAMDVFVLPSRFEGLPIVAIEAQAAGLPCFVSDSVTKETAVTDQIIFLPLEVSAWREGILSGIKRRGNRSNYAKQVSMAGYDMERYIKVLEDLYDDYDYGDL